MSTRWIALIAATAIVFGAALYGYRTGWFGGSDDDEFVPPNLNEAANRTPRPVDHRETAFARAEWSAPSGTPLVGVGSAVSATAPTHATLAVADGRANVGIVVPRTKSDGKPFNGYLVEVRSGDQRVWSMQVPLAGAKSESDAIWLSLNLAALHSAGADAAPLSVLVGGAGMRKGETLGIARLELPPAP